MFAISDFNINRNNINADLSKYIMYVKESFSERCMQNILKDFESIEDYIYILYWLKFEKKLNYSEIGKILNPESKSKEPHHIAYTRYCDVRLNYSTNFQETEKYFFDELDKLKKVKEQSYIVKFDELGLNESQVNEYNELLEKNITLYKKSKRRHSKIRDFNYKDLEHYFTSFYYMYKVVKLSSIQIAKVFNTSVGAISNRLEELGLTNDIKTAQEIAVEFNRRNYKNTISTGRKTLNKSLIEKGEFGSTLENVIRNNFLLYLVEYINSERYEIIVGINNRSIIQPKEVDIPVVIIDLMDEKIFKFAIEINGQYFHEVNTKEMDKRKMLTDKNWEYFDIWQFSSTKTQKEYGKIDEQIKRICNSIKTIVCAR